MALVDRIAEHPGRINLIDVETGETTGPYDIERNEGAVSVEGTPLTAANLQQEIENEVATQYAGLFATKTTTLIDNLTIAAGGYDSTSISASVALSGYTPAAFRDLRIENATTGGTGRTLCFAYHWEILGDTVKVGIRNTGSNAAVIKVVADILYVKDTAL